jgi:glycosyltransferase involved in cell wall biosynthesis
MTRVVVFITELTSTSIPLEIAAEVHRTTDTEILIVSYYDASEDNIDPDVEDLNVPIARLGANSRLDVSALYQLRKVCADDGIDILHTHHNSTGSLARLVVSGTDTAIVNTEHNDHRFFTTLQKIVNSATYKLVDTNVSNSQSTKESFEWYERGILSGVRQQVIYNGIDQARIDNAGASPVDLPNGPNITVVGSLIEQKNHATLLYAFQAVNNISPESSLIIVGDGPLSNDLKSLANELDLQKDVLFTGYLPYRDDVYAILSESQIGVFPSRYEGFCVAAVEAMAVGLPVVVSDIDVLHEVVGDPGVFADPNDPEDFADAINDLLQQPEKRARLGEEAKDRSRSKFPLKRTAREYSTLYKEVAEASNR